MGEWLLAGPVDTASLLLGLVPGLLLGLVLAGLLWWQGRRQQQQQVEQEAARQVLQQQLESLRQEQEQAREALARSEAQRQQLEAHQAREKAELQQREQQVQAQLARLRQEHDEQGRQMAALEARYQSEAQSWQQRLEELQQMREQLKKEFAELSRKNLEAESRQFAQQSETRLQQLLQPMQQRLQDFQQQLQQGREQDIKDREGLREQIRKLAEENQRITAEAHALTRALTSQAKTRGNWGERQIERALELSGLQEGREYDREVSLEDDRGRRWRPDVLVHLPEGRALIIDAKLSLNHYIDYVNAKEEEQRQQALKAHVQALKLHVKSLAEKRYDRLKGVKSLDFVLMFVPNESAFVEAINHEPALYDEAFRQHVVIVTTSTLLASLQTIANLWRYEKQQRNAQKMAEHASKLYDKFVGFVEDMEKLGQRLRQAGESYDGAMNKLRDGRGNLMRQMEGFVELGAQPRKRLSLADSPEADTPAPADEDSARR